MNKFYKILGFLLFLGIFIFLPSLHSLQASQCNEWLEASINAVISNVNILNFDLSGTITDGICAQGCDPPAGGQWAVADPMVELAYKFDSEADSAYRVLTKGPSAQWYLLIAASPAIPNCNSSTYFHTYYQSFEYRIAANDLSISSLAPGSHTLHLRGKYDIAQYFFVDSFLFTKPAPSVNLKVRPTGSGNYSDGPITINYNTGIDLQWTVANSSACTASANPANANWTGSKSTSGGTQTINNLTQTTTFTITCTESGGGSATDSVVVNVSPATCPVTLTATPASGTAPLLDVDLTADISGTATGTIVYKFSCLNDGTWQHTSAATTTDPYPIANLCDYATAGTYTAKAQVTRGSCTSTDTVSIAVGTAAFDFSISASPLSGSTYRGGSTTSTITVTRTAGTAAAVSFSVPSPDPFPPNITYSFSPTSCTPSSGTCTSIMTVSISPSAYAGGSMDMYIRGTAGSVMHSVIYNISVYNRAPNTPVLVTPANNSCINYNPTFQATVSDPDSADYIHAYFSINSFGVGAGASVSSGTVSSWGPVTMNDGNWWWQAWAEDTLIATSSETTYWYFTKDTVAPIASISSPEGTITTTAINVTLTESDATSGIAEGDVDVSINGAGWVNTGLPTGGSTINNFTYTGTVGSTYQFRYRVKDNCGNWSAYKTDDPLTIFNFSLTVSPTSGSVIRGSSVSPSPTVTATLLAGTTKAVALSASSSPTLTGGSINLSPASCNPTCTSTMTISTAGSTPTGTYIITITGTGGEGIVHTATYTLTVNAAATLSCTLSASPSSGTVPLNDVDLTADPAGTATGNTTYRFDCNGDAVYETTVASSSSDPYTALDVCDYAAAGTYNAGAKVERQGQEATCSTTVTVSAVPTCSVVLSATPSSGTAPLNDVDLSGDVSGTATGNMVYKFDCTNDGTWDHTSASILTDPYTIADLCDYATAATYTAEVEVTRGTAVCSDTETITVSAVPTCSVVLSATPSSGTAPLNDVDLSGDVSGTATGNMVYKFDCTNDGTWDHTSASILTDPYTIADLCDYATAATYTAEVEVTRGTAVCSDTETITVSAAATLSVALSATPASGTAPLNDVDLTAVLGGTATGTINYTFYCNRSDTGTNIIAGYAFKIDGRNADGTGGTVIYWGVATSYTGGTTFLVRDVCDYAADGTYSAKVIAERGGSAAEDRETVTVGSAPTCSVVLSATPSSGTAPLNDVDLSGDVSGTATGNMVYKFDCTNDGTWDHTSASILTDPYTIADLCDYATAATYTAEVEVTRGTAVCSDTQTITVGSAFDFSMSVSPTTGTVIQGNTVSPLPTVTATLSTGTTQAVTFSASSSPALTGGSINFSVASCNPTCNSTMTVTTAASTPSGVYTITITGTGGSLTRTTTYTLTVGAAFNFSMSVSPTSGSVVQGGSVAPVATATLSSGTTQAVTFSASSSPALTGGSINFSVASCNPTCNSTMTVTTAASTPSGVYTITITGTGGSLTRTTTYTLTVGAETLSVNLTANKTSGPAPLTGVNLTAALGGTALGTINYTFYCNKPVMSGSPPGLVGYWNLDEGSGTTAQDTSGSGNNGTLINGPVWTTGRNGGALDFDGVNDNVDMGDPANGSLDMGTSDFTVSAWVYVDALPATPAATEWRPIVAKYATPGWAIFLQTNTSGVHKWMFYANDTGSKSVSSNNPVVAGQWYHVLGRVSSGILNLFVDGAQQTATNTRTGTIDNTTTFHIGGAYGSKYLDAKIDDVRIFNRALTPAEILDVYNFTGGATSDYDFKIDARNPDGTGGTVIYQGTATSWSGGTTFTVNDACSSVYNSPGTYTARVIAERGSLSAQDTETITVSSAFNFSMSVSPTSGSVVQGGSVAPVATATLSSGTTQAVTFSATSSPALTGGSISFSPTSCNPTCTSIMTVTTAASTPSGAYTITITGTGGSLTRTTTYTLTVNAATLSCTISANPASGNAPLNDVDFTATVAGTAVGTINYTFYCNRNDTSTSVFPIPPNPNYDHKLDGTSTNPYTATNICDYAAIGSYAGKVIVEKGVLAAECKTTVTVNNNPPTATNLQRIDANCCSSNPAYFFSWVYADPDLNTESRFEFQADNNSGFGSAEVNRNITGLSNPSPTTNNQSVLLVLSPIADQLGYGSIIYYWRVRVYDSTGLNSGWVNGTSFTTPARHYPDPTFSWLPWLPSPAEQIQFSSSGSICYDQNPAGASCTNILDGGTSTYYWTFQPDATPPQHPETNPKTKFSTKGIKPVTLTITDGLGNACTATQNVNVRFPLPKWREVAP